MSIISPAFLSLQPTSSSFPFQAKFIPIQGNMRITIGAQAQDAPGRPARRAAPTNGIFSPIPSTTDGAPVLPITLDSRHVEAWIGANNILYIRDLGTGYGTFVNGVKLEAHHDYALQRGDILVRTFRIAVLALANIAAVSKTLGRPIARNANTPSYIVEEQLKPVIARISFSGVNN
ncbi:hypothetical protein PQX77_011042 [Marasmius sp. AFHP31]|nr:hypothetical protein PQX77_011042 [Marasmius sp. AFHP31]